MIFLRKSLIEAVEISVQHLLLGETKQTKYTLTVAMSTACSHTRDLITITEGELSEEEQKRFDKNVPENLKKEFNKYLENGARIFLIFDNFVNDIKKSLEKCLPEHKAD